MNSPVESVVIGVAAGAILLVLVFLNPWLGAVALCGLVVGWLVTLILARWRRSRRNQRAPAGWYPDPETPGKLRYWNGWLWSKPLERARTVSRRQTAVIISSVILACLFAMIVAVVAVMSGGRDDAPRAISRSIYRIAISSEVEYRPDINAFAITDVIRLPIEASAAICNARESPGDGGATEIRGAAADGCARSAIEGAGWAYAGDDTGRPTFTRSRQAPAEVPWWPLSVTRSIDEPEVDLDTLTLLAGEGSTATIIGPKRLVRASSPPASSTELLLDPAGREAVEIPIGGRWSDGVRLELVSPVARNPVVAPLLSFSLWGSANWIVLAFAAIFQEQVRGVLKRWAGAVGRLAPSRRQPAKRTEPEPVPDSPSGGNLRDESDGDVSTGKVVAETDESELPVSGRDVRRPEPA